MMDFNTNKKIVNIFKEVFNVQIYTARQVLSHFTTEKL